MRDNLAEGCPTAVDLRAYSQMGSGRGTVTDAVRLHVENCLNCKLALDALAGTEQVPEKALSLDEALHRTLDRQREYLDTMLVPRKRVPKAGEIWATRCHSRAASSASEPLIAFLVLVLRSFVREYTGTVVTDVAPVTEDPWLAAEWSVIVDSDHSGVGNTVVAHLDTQVTTTATQLNRYVGSLAEYALADLATALRAYDCAEPPPSDLKVARMGQVAIRRLAAWSSLTQDLDHLVSQLLVVIVDEDQDETTAREPTLPGGFSAPRDPNEVLGTPAGLSDLKHWRESDCLFPSIAKRDPGPLRRVAEASPQYLLITVASVVKYCLAKGRANTACNDLIKLLTKQPLLRRQLSDCFVAMAGNWPRSLREHIAPLSDVDEQLQNRLFMALQNAKHACMDEWCRGDSIHSKAARSVPKNKDK